MKRTARILGIAAVLLILLAVALPLLVNANQFKPRLETALTSALGRRVTVGGLKLALFSGSVTADDLAVEDDPAFSKSPFLHAKTLTLTVELWPLIASHKLNITGLTIEAPEIALIQSAGGMWNFSGLGRKSAAAMGSAGDSQADLQLSARLIKLTDGRISITSQPQTKAQVFEGITAGIQNFTSTMAFPFSFSSKAASGGDISLSGTAGPIDPVDVARTPLTATLNLSNLNLAASGFVDPASGIDGLLSIDGKGSSDGHTLKWDGALKVDKPKLARGGIPGTRPVQFSFAIQHDLQNHRGALSSGAIQVGKVQASLTGTYTQQQGSTLLNLHLVGTAMPVADLNTMLPPLDIVLPNGSSLQGGTAHTDVIVTGSTGNLVTTGAAGVASTTLAGFDLGNRMSTLERLAGIKASPNTQIEKFDARFRASTQGVEIGQMTMSAPSLGNLDGAGTIGANHALDLKMRATVHGNLLTAAFGQRGDTQVPFFIQGDAANPIFKPDVNGIAAAEIQRLSKGTIGKAASDLLGGFFGGKKP